jgi:hypothetical protein
MTIKRCLHVIFLVLSFMTSAWAGSVTMQTHPKFKQIFHEITKQQKQGSTLLVFDIDNTLLKFKQDFGSPAWFDWQKDCVKAHKDCRIVSNFNELIAISDLAIESQTMTLTEPKLNNELATLIQQNKDKMQALIVTARSPALRSVTLGSLQKQQLHFDQWSSCADPQRCIFSMIGNKQLPALFDRGVVYSAGQKKGDLLKQVLLRLQLRPRTIVFMDDSQHNLDQVAEAFKDEPVQLILMRYSGMDLETKDFLQSVDRQGRTLQYWQQMAMHLR